MHVIEEKLGNHFLAKAVSYTVLWSLYNNIWPQNATIDQSESSILESCYICPLCCFWTLFSLALSLSLSVWLQELCMLHSPMWFFRFFTPLESSCEGNCCSAEPDGCMWTHTHTSQLLSIWNRFSCECRPVLQVKTSLIGSHGTVSSNSSAFFTDTSWLCNQFETSNESQINVNRKRGMD